MVDDSMTFISSNSLDTGYPDFPESWVMEFQRFVRSIGTAHYHSELPTGTATRSDVLVRLKTCLCITVEPPSIMGAPQVRAFK